MSHLLQLKPANNDCIDCTGKVDPKKDRQELAWEQNGKCRRRCGKCIAKRNSQ